MQIYCILFPHKYQLVSGRRKDLFIANNFDDSSELKGAEREMQQQNNRFLDFAHSPR